MRTRQLSAAAYSLILFGTACSVSQNDEAQLEKWKGAVVVSSAACEVEYLVSSQWDGGFGANVRVTNKGDAVNSWTLSWTFADGQQVTSLWNGKVQQSAGGVSVSDLGWNRTLVRGASVTVGFNGTWSGNNGTPTGFALNGVSCEGGSTNPPDDGGTNDPPTTNDPPDDGGTSDTGSCSVAAFDTSASYSAGDRVSAGGQVYECKPYPYSGWCPLNGYEPGTGNYWNDAWAAVGDCGTTTNPPDDGGTNDPPTNDPPDDGGSCDAPAWRSGTSYVPGDVVSYGGALYVAVHENPGYDPVISNWFWDPHNGGCTPGGDDDGNTDNPPDDGGPTDGTGFSSLISEAQFNQLFPNRNPFYSYSGLLEAIKKFPQFANVGDITTRKREAAAFLANATHETGHFIYIEEIAKNNYCDSSPWFCPCAPGHQYYGRGPIQLSWNYNYCYASEYIFGDREVLRTNPERVAQEPWLAWATALWFWMTQSGAGTMTPHSAMINNIGFGETIRSINGGLECNGANPGTVQTRIQYYQQITSLIGVDPGANQGC